MYTYMSWRRHPHVLAMMESTCHGCGMSDSLTPDEANSALSLAAQANRAARGPRSVPRWLPPTAALLCAAGFVALALFNEHPSLRVYLIVVVAALVASLVLVALAIRLGGVAPQASGSAREQALRQLIVLIPLLLGAVAAVFYGFTGFTAVFGVGLGVSLWAQLTRYSKGDRP